ncbi:MAG: CbiX/SirB N-terminal domain-containing protein [Verrucomicrobiota bacterium]
MSLREFKDATVVVLGHGSTKNTDSAAAVYLQAAALRALGVFGEVQEGFWKQDPMAGEVLAEVLNPRVFILPLFISEGYFTDDVIPRALKFRPGEAELSRVQRRGAQTWYYCRPIGTHERMTGVLLSRAREVVRRHPFPRAPREKDITLFIAGHGTPQNDQSRAAIDVQVERVRSMDLYASVQPVFIEEPPLVSECYALAPTRNFVVVPFFISDGMHVQEDLPRLLGEPAELVKKRLAAGVPAWHNPTERNGKLAWCSAAVGTAPELTAVMLERIREAATL